MDNISELKDLINFTNITKNFNVLYIEDNNDARKVTSRILEIFFNNIIISINGKDGLQAYNNSLKTDPIDIIITDIDMPIMNGVEMISEIRKTNNDVVIIVTSAKTDTNYLLEAIRLKVDLFLVKPIDINKLGEFIQNLCKLKLHDIEIQNKEKETKSFIDILNKIAIVSKTDLKGTITQVNDNFIEISGYSKEELLNSHHNIIRHPDEPKEIFEDLWETIKNDSTWEGEIKNRKKDGTSYWVKSIINPIFENDIKVGYLAVRQDITNKKILEEMSITDELTQISNRRHFNQVFPKEINIARRNNELLNFVILDVDHFKKYNDTYGHAKGDEVLISVANTLKQSLRRAKDYCFRLGGEEFGILFYSESKSKSLEFCNTLKQSIEDLKINHKENTASEFITASFGLSILENIAIADIEDIFIKTDEMLYKAKNNGRNRVGFYVLK